MANKTANDVVIRALRRLNIVAIGETADPDIYVDALAEYVGFHEWLEKEFQRDLRWNYNAVPEEYWPHVSGWLSGTLADVFPIGDAMYSKAKISAKSSETALREILARRRIKTTPAEYF